MGRFPTAGHLASWAGLAPVARQSGPRTRNRKKSQGDAYLGRSARPPTAPPAPVPSSANATPPIPAPGKAKAKSPSPAPSSIIISLDYLAVSDLTVTLGNAG